MRCTATHLTALCEPQSLPIESVGYRILKGSPLAHAAQESVTYVQVAATLTRLNRCQWLHIETCIHIAWCGSEVVIAYAKLEMRKAWELVHTYKASFRRGPLCRILSPLGIYKLVCKHINLDCCTPKIFNTHPLTNFLNEAQHTCTCMSTVCIMSISQCSARFHLP